MVETQGSCRGGNTRAISVTYVPFQRLSFPSPIIDSPPSILRVCLHSNSRFLWTCSDYLLRATILIVPSLMGYSTSSTDSLMLLIPPDTTWNGGLMVLLVVQAKSKKTIRMKELYHLHTLIPLFAKVCLKNSELQTHTHGRPAISKPRESDGVSVITSYVAFGSAAFRQ